MAGLSSRFLKAGYTKPKYMLEINKESVFIRAVSSFKCFFNIHKFLFIYRNINDTKNFIKQECKKIQLQNYECVELDKETLGQAHTCYLGLLGYSKDESILIFNIDTFRLNFSLPNTFDINKIDGYLEVFKASGEQYSFVKTLNNSNKVIQTAEKMRISNLCSTGLYYFRKCGEFKEIFIQMQHANDTSKNEFYIAPMYNYLIAKGMDIRVFEISINDIIFCGLPSEYEALISHYTKEIK